MPNRDNRTQRRRGCVVLVAGMTGIVLALGAAGCGRSGSPSDASNPTPTRPQTGADQLAVSGAVISTPTVPEDAAILAEAYPRLASGALAYARLMPLPDGMLLHAESLAISRAELDAELRNMPQMQREMLRHNEFMLLEQIATGALLEQEARRNLIANGLDVTVMSRDLLLQTWMGRLVADVTVDNAELEAFYQANQEMMGGAAFDRIRPQLIQHLTQEKQQEAVETYIREMGRRTLIALDADWTDAQDTAMRDNPVDRARDSGMPTLVSFGADSCRPCQMMKPFREAIALDYEGVVNVVYVHVNQDQILASRYGVRGIPHVIFFDRNGNEFFSRTGLMTQDRMEAVLSDMGVAKPAG